MTKAYLYVASHGDQSKIGVTRWPRERIGQIQRDTGDPYEAMMLWEAEAMAAFELERQVIVKLSDIRTRGSEWFNLKGDELVRIVEEMIPEGMFTESEMPRYREKKPVKDPYMLSLPPLWKNQASDIAHILDGQRPETTRPVSRADAIRYAISFCHKQLTEVLNPEDLDDDR